MAVRLQGDFYSEKGAKYTVGIYDSSFSGAATDFDATNVISNTILMARIMIGFAQ